MEVRVVLKERRQFFDVDDPCIEIMDCMKISALNKSSYCIDKYRLKSGINRLRQVGLELPDKGFRRFQWVRVRFGRKMLSIVSRLFLENRCIIDSPRNLSFIVLYFDTEEIA